MNHEIKRSETAAPWLLMLVAVCLVTLNLRMTITGVGPLLDEIAADQRVTPAVLGTLASVPLFTWAILSPLVPRLAALIGMDAAIDWSLLGLTFATIVRSLPGLSINLWLGTILLGASIAVGNVLLPAVIKRDFGKRVPLIMGIYSALLGIAGAIGAGLVAPIAHFETTPGVTLDWRWALLASGVLAPAAIVFWRYVSRRRLLKLGTVPLASTYVRSTPVGSVWRDPVAWCISIYVGAQSWFFFTYAMWLGPIGVSKGIEPVAMGAQVMLLHTYGVVGALSGPFLARILPARVLPIVMPALAALGAIGFVYSPSHLWLVLCGISGGITLYFSLNFLPQRSRDPSITSAVSGMSQSFGYSFAAFGPILFGLLYQTTDSWASPLVVLSLGAVAQIIAAIALWNQREVLPERSQKHRG